jgi:hypothetical protein
MKWVRWEWKDGRMTTVVMMQTGWQCHICLRYGLVEHGEDAPMGEVLKMIEWQHQGKAGMCHGGLRSIRLQVVEED